MGDSGESGVLTFPSGLHDHSGHVGKGVLSGSEDNQGPEYSKTVMANLLEL